MSSLNNFQEDHYQDRFQAGILGFFDKMISETIPKNKNLVIGVLIAVIAAAAFFINSNKASQNAVLIEQEKLGKVIVLAQQGKVPEQTAALDELLAIPTLSIETQVKATLMRADLHFSEAKYQEALASYQKVQSLGVDHPIVTAAADQGVASSQMQLKQYAEAKASLEAYVSKYSQRNEDRASRYSQSGKEDLIPFVPAALFKLALVNAELKDNSAAKLACEKILKVYPESNEARLANQLLPSL